MTIGTRVSDDRSYGQDSWSGTNTSLYGAYYATSWSGGDRAYPGDLTPHNYTKSVYESYCSPVPLGLGHQGNPFTGYGKGVTPNLQFTNNDVLKLYSKLGSKIRDHDFNAAIFLAEADQSLALIGETATRLAKFLGNLKSGNLYKAASFISGTNGNKNGRTAHIADSLRKHFTNKSAFDDRKALANAILEVQYGWRPLLSDANSAGVYVGSLLSKPPRSTYKATRTLNATVVDRNGDVRWTVKKVISERLLATISSPPSWQTQLRLNNPAQAISNRTPWSFVANWFLPFEDYLEARSTFTDLNISRLIRTRKTTTKGLFTHPLGGDASYKEWNFVREILDTSDNSNVVTAIPLPNFKPIEKSLSWEHVMNGIALLNGTVKRYRD